MFQKLQKYQRVDDNKTDLFHFLTNLPLANIDSKTVLMTYDGNVVQFGKGVDTSEISPCSHEEADAAFVALLACSKMWHETHHYQNC